MILLYLDHLKPEGITEMLRLLLFQDTNHLKLKEMVKSTFFN